MTEGWTLPAEHVERIAEALARTGRLLGTTSPDAVADALDWRAVRYFGGDEVLTDVGVPAGDSVALRFAVQAGRRGVHRCPRIRESRLPWRRRFATMTLELSPTGHGVQLAIRPEDEAARHAAAARAEATRAEATRAAAAVTTRPDGAHPWADGDWDRFAAVLTAELADLEPDHSIIVDGDDGHVQFIQFGEHGTAYLYAETVNDTSFNDGRPLTAGQQRRLSDLGWDEPPTDPEPDNAAIWSYHLPWPARWNTYERLAGMAVAALRDVHSVRTPADLQLGGWGYDNTEPAPYPRLGLPTWHEAL